MLIITPLCDVSVPALSSLLRFTSERLLRFILSRFLIHVHCRGLTCAEEELLCMAPLSCPALQDRTSAIRTSLAGAAAHSCDLASRGQRTPLRRFREDNS